LAASSVGPLAGPCTELGGQRRPRARGAAPEEGGAEAEEAGGSEQLRTTRKKGKEKIKIKKEKEKREKR